MQQGHQTMFVDGHPPLAVDQMILEEVEGILILTMKCMMRLRLVSRGPRVGQFGAT
jgi:hypothetical protein